MVTVPSCDPLSTHYDNQNEPCLFFLGIATATTGQSAGAYLADAVNKDHMATLQSIMAAVIEGVGTGAGSLLGGILIRKWSSFICYVVFAIASCVFSFILLITWCFESGCIKSSYQKVTNDL